MLKRILNSRVYDLVQETPLDFAKSLSTELKNQVFLKREDLHQVFSFKIRGAYNCLAKLTDEQKAKGVVAASAGNHAQGVALSAQKLGIEATIFMPVTTPPIKVEAVRSYGAQVFLHGDNYSEAAEECQKHQLETGKTYIHPFDDLEVIAGQGTVGIEILKQSPGNLNALFVPVGGGGLLAGILAYVKELRPEIKIIGVEPEDSDAMTQSLEANGLITLKNVGIFADGVAVKKVGTNTFQICQKWVDHMITVNTDEICSAIKAVHKDTRSLVEPAGALAVAGLKKWVQTKGIENQNLVAICSGANMNFERLTFIAERTRIGEKQEALFAIHLPEKPGALRTLCTQLLDAKNITEFNYRKTSLDQAEIFVGLSTGGEAEQKAIIKELQAADYPCVDITNNNLAKTHVRYMIGSRSNALANEHLFSFRFPERPGALKDFLNALKVEWNISLFHFRSRGGDFGQVLVALETGSSSSEEICQAMDSLGYEYEEETQNPVYKFFLKGQEGTSGL